MSLDPIASFAKVARRFCDLTASGAPAAHDLAVALAALYLHALALPDVYEEDAPEPADPPQPRLDLPIDYYGVVFDPFPMPPDAPVVGSFYDDIGDIRRDVVRGLDLFDRGHPIGACWKWWFDFHFHWGEHLVNAQRVLFLWMQVQRLA